MKIAVLASGGVDSSVVLRLLKDEGHDVTAFYLKIWLEDELSFLGSCPWEEDLEYIRKICTDLHVPLKVVSMQKEYWDEVVTYALNEIKLGRTPNSDIMCNSKVKFGRFYEKITEDFDVVATGHYAQKEEKDGIHYLKKAKDTRKDQTYFLAHLTQNQLKRAIFPIGKFPKSEVRELAAKFDLPNQARKDSQGICFLGKLKFPDFLKYHFGTKIGDLVELETGKVLGKHEGYWYFTIGQRQGIKLSGGPWFVTKKDLTTNTVYISKHYLENEQPRDTFNVTDFNWINQSPTPEQFSRLQVKVRHGEALYDATFTSINSTEAQIHISGSDQGFAPGQFAVFYSDENCLGCAVIQ